MVVKYRPYHFEDLRGFEQGIGNILFPLAEKEIGGKFNWIFLLAYSKTSFQFLFPQKDAKCKVTYEQEAIENEKVILTSNCIHMNDNKRIYVWLKWIESIRWSTTLYGKFSKLTASSNIFIPLDISENSFYFIRKADKNLSKNMHKVNFTLKSQRLFGAELW